MLKKNNTLAKLRKIYYNFSIGYALYTLNIYYEEKDVDLDSLLSNALNNLGEGIPDIVKGVKKMMSARKLPEPLEKGILRAKHDVYVFKDGTTRFDATDIPLTHFKPKEIGVSIDKLKELGYE